MSVEELRARRRADSVAKLRSLHVDGRLRRPSRQTADMWWDQYVKFLRSNPRLNTDAEVDRMIAEATAGPITLRDTDPELYNSIKRKQALKVNRTPDEKRRDRRAERIAVFGFLVFIAACIVVFYFSGRADPCSFVGGLSGRECADDRQDDESDYYPGIEVCDLPPAAWGEPVTCTEFP